MMPIIWAMKCRYSDIYELTNLLSYGTSKHNWCDVKGREAEVKVAQVVRLHDVHVDQVLCIALLYRD